MSLPIAALGAEDRIGVPVDDPPPADAGPRKIVLEAAVSSGPDVAAQDAPAEGIWAWVARLEGEVLTPEGAAAIRERAEVRRSEGALVDALGDPDVPRELYQDPSIEAEDELLGLNTFDPSRYDIPVEINADVRRWMRYFLGSGRKHFQRYLQRSGSYLPLMHSRLAAAGLPQDLVYLAMIESGFHPQALSHAGAAGLWQFMPATGRMYDLRVDWWVDDRRDPVKATDAAVAHLADLHKMFKGDWYLAWSAYNAGPGRVRRAMKDADSADFWALVKGGHLPKETSNYVPKILAAAILAKDADRYGFDMRVNTALSVDTIWVDGSYPLATLANAVGMSVEQLRDLNPGLRRTATPAEGYALSVPAPRAKAAREAIAALPESERARFVKHTVVRGETLSSIAARHGVGADDLVKANGLDDKDRIVIGMSLIVPKLDEGPVASARRSDTDVYTVRAGDSLSAIAREHGVSTADLRTWNGITGDVIRPGQRLLVRASAHAPAERVVRYTVTKGDTLSGVAARFGVSVGDLQRWNKIKDASHVRVGQVLQVQL